MGALDAQTPRSDICCSWAGLPRRAPKALSSGSAYRLACSRMLFNNFRLARKLDCVGKAGGRTIWTLGLFGGAGAAPLDLAIAIRTAGRSAGGGRRRPGGCTRRPEKVVAAEECLQFVLKTEHGESVYEGAGTDKLLMISVPCAG